MEFPQQEIFLSRKLHGHRVSSFAAFAAFGVIMKSIVLLIAPLLFLLGGCNPTVKVDAPDKPIEINLNVKIEHNIRLQVDKELESLFDKESDVF